MLDDALLDLFEAVVVLVEDALGGFEVEAVFRHHVPRQVEHQVHVVRLDAVFCGLGVHPFELRELLCEVLGCGLGPILRLRLHPPLRIFLGGRVVPEFFLDLLELLVQEKLPLLLVELPFDLALNVPLETQHRLFLVQQLEDAVCPGPDAFDFEESLLLRHLGVHVRGDEVHEEAEAVDAADGHARFRRDVRAQRNDLEGEFFQALHQGLVFVVARRQVFGIVLLHAGAEVGFLLHDFHPLEPFLALQNDGRRPIGHAQHLHHARDRADMEQVLAGGHLDFVAALAHHADRIARFVRGLDEPDAPVAPDGDGNHDAGKQHRVAQGKQGQRFGHHFAVHRFLVFAGNQGNKLVLEVAFHVLLKSVVFVHHRAPS